MTPDEITAIFALATDNFAHISGQPSDDDLTAILLATKPLLHELDYDDYGTHNLVGLIEPSNTYTATWGDAFPIPARPDAYDTNIQDDATPVVRNRMEAAHKLLLHDYATYLAAERGVAKFIRDVVDETFYKDLEDPVSFYNKITAAELINHLRLNCGGVEPENLVALHTEMSSYYANCDGIPEYIIMLEKARLKFARADLPMSDKQLLIIANASVYGSQDFVRASEDWERLTPNNKTWTTWKTTFLRAHRERLRLIQASGGISLGSANAAGGLRGIIPSPTTDRLNSYLDNIANAATQDSHQLKLLLESNKTLIEQNRLLAEQFTALSARVNTATPTTTPPPSGTRKTPAQLLTKRLTKYSPTNYCHTHGYMVHATHTSATCNTPGPNHITTATRADTKGGVEYNKGWELAAA